MTWRNYKESVNAFWRGTLKIVEFSLQNTDYEIFEAYYNTFEEVHFNSKL